MAKILIGYSVCPLTRAAFEAHGHEVWTCDLLPSRENALFHYQGDIADILNDNWAMAVLHPMCTYLTCSAAWAFGDGPYHQKIKPGTLVGEARREARREAIAGFAKLLDLPYPVAIENPSVSFVNKAIRSPDQVIQPHCFGDDASKGTGLWLNDLPPLKSTGHVQPRMVCGCGNTFHSETNDRYGCPNCCGDKPARPRWSNQTDSGQNRLIPGPNRWLERSATYPGIAAAMGDQWGKLFK